MKAAIVGGGWAGLSTAVELAKAGVGVTVFEAAKQLGGRARSVDLHGHRLDNGQHLLVGAYCETLRLMREVGAEPERLLKRLPRELRFQASPPRPFPHTPIYVGGGSAPHPRPRRADAPDSHTGDWGRSSRSEAPARPREGNVQFGGAASQGLFTLLPFHGAGR